MLANVLQQLVYLCSYTFVKQLDLISFHTCTDYFHITFIVCNKYNKRYHFSNITGCISPRLISSLGPIQAVIRKRVLFSIYNCGIKVMHIPVKINMFATRTVSFLIKQNYICIKCKWRHNLSRLKTYHYECCNVFQIGE